MPTLDVTAGSTGGGGAVAELTRRAWMSLALAGVAGCAARPLELATAPRPEGLDALARAKGLRFGSAVGAGPARTPTGSFHDPRYRELLLAECGVIVPENELKWYVVRPAPETYAFERADLLAGFAREHALDLRGHTLLWHHPRWFPGWVRTHDFGARPATEASRLIVDYVRTTCARYSDVIHSWDVVNETVDAETGALRETEFSRRMGDAAAPVDLAFRAARAAAPDAQLVYNDYMSWETGHEAHRVGVLRLLEGLRKRDVPVDALGVQSHIGSDNNKPSPGFDTRQEREWRRFMDEVTSMGYDVLITEFDVHDNGLPGDIAARDRGVAEFARDYLDLMLSYPQVKQVLAWGMADQYSWLQERWARPDGLAKRPTPYDAQYQPKPLRDALAAAFRAAPPRGPAAAPHSLRSRGLSNAS